MVTSLAVLIKMLGFSCAIYRDGVKKEGEGGSLPSLVEVIFNFDDMKMTLESIKFNIKLILRV